MTQVELAGLVGTNGSELRRWERGQPIPTAYQQRIVDVLNIPSGQEPWVACKKPAGPSRGTARLLPEFFPEALKAARLKIGLAVEQAAVLAGVSSITWSRWEAGANSPKMDALRAAVRTLGCEIGDVLGQPTDLAGWRVHAGMTQSDLIGELRKRQLPIANKSLDRVVSWEQGAEVPVLFRRALVDILNIPRGQEPWDMTQRPTIAEWRGRAGITQEQLRKQLGVTHRALHLWETKVSPVPTEMRRRIVDILNIPRGQEPWDPDTDPDSHSSLPLVPQRTLRQWREERELTQTQLGDIVGTTATTVGKWEREIGPSAKYRRKIARALRIPPGQEPWAASNVHPLQEWREKAELYKSEVARSVGVSGSAIGHWEGGAAVPPKYWEKLRRALRIPPGQEPWATNERMSLATWRKKRNVNSKELAQLIGTYSQAVSAWEAGGDIPPAYRGKIADVLDIPPGQEPWDDNENVPDKPPPGYRVVGLRKMRRLRGLTTHQASEQVGVAESVWKAWETEQSIPSEKRLLSLTTILGCSIGDILSPPESLRDWRRVAGLTQNEVAQKIGVASSLVGDWENKIAPVHPRHRRRLAEALGIPRGQEPWDPSEPWALENPLPTCLDGQEQRNILILKQRRAYQNLTQAQVAEQVGAHPASVGLWELGHNVPVKHRARYAEVLGIPPGEEPWPLHSRTSSELKQWRHAAGLTQREVANRLGVAPDTYGNWERGTRVPVWHRQKVAAALGIPSGQEPWMTEQHARYPVQGLQREKREAL